MANTTTGASKQDDIAQFIAQWLTDTLRREVDTKADFASIGLDSLEAVSLTDAITERWALAELPVSVVLDYPSIPALSAHLATLST